MLIDLKKDGFAPPDGVVFTTPRLTIREFTRRDAPAYHLIFTDERVTKFIPWIPYTALEQTKKYIAKLVRHQRSIPRGKLEFAIALKSTSQLIGYTMLNVNTLFQSAERAIVLAPSVWNRGYATETQSSMLDFGFERLGLHRIWATCDPENRASQAMMKKTGMQYEGRLRESRRYPRDGRFSDSLVFAILRTEWDELKHSRMNMQKT